MKHPHSTPTTRNVDLLINESAGAEAMFVFILASAANVINDHDPINVVCQPGIEPVTFLFQNNHEGTKRTTLPRRQQTRCNEHVWYGIKSSVPHPAGIP